MKGKGIKIFLLLDETFLTTMKQASTATSECVMNLDLRRNLIIFSRLFFKATGEVSKIGSSLKPNIHQQILSS